MSFLKVYIFLILVILSFINLSWTIDVPKIVKLKIIPSRRVPWKKKIQCLTKGDPKPELSWTFENKPIEDNDRYDFENDKSVLVINYPTTKDSGKYRCYAANTLGMIFAQIQLKIVGIGMFNDGFTKDDIPLLQNVTIGKPVKIPCPNHTDEPGQTYTWATPPLDIWHPGNPIPRAFLSDSHGALYFSYITEDDIKMINRKGISCLLFVDYNNLEASVKINLQSDGKESTENIAPEMVVFFKNESIGVEGEKKELRCGATGRPHPIFRWYKDGKPISTEDGSDSLLDHILIDGKGLVLTITKLTKNDEGNYKCVASNSEGTVSKESHLFIHSKVAWTKELDEKYTIPVKDKISLTCDAKGLPAPKYVWYHNNSVMVSSERRKVDHGTMEIEKSDFGDCGMYLCTAENYLNTIVSPAYVKIADVPPVFTKKISELYYFFVGATYKLTCDATGGPEPTISWYQNDNLITSGEHLKVTPDGKTLMLSDVTKGQNGVYKCFAENRKAKISSAGDVKVFVKTVITRAPSKVRYPAGYSAYLFCDADYDKTLTWSLKWYKDGEKIEYDDRVYLKDKDRVTKVTEISNTLKVKDVVPGDGGEYKCVVSTDDGVKFRSEDKASGSITVIAPPLMVGNLRLTGSFDKEKKKESDDGDKIIQPTKAPGSGDGTTGTTIAPPKDGEVILSWNKPSKYVGPADKYIIEYAPANSSDWTQYDPPKKYENTSVKLDKDKLPASSDLVFRIRAIATNNDKEMVGKPSEPTKPGSLVTPSRAPKEQPSNVRLQMKDKENSTITWDKPDDIDNGSPGFKTVGKYRQIKPKNDSKYVTFEADGDDTSAAGPVAPDDGVDREYEVLVASKNDAGQGPWKRSILKVPGNKPTAKVDGVTLVEATEDGAKIKWDPVPGASEYRIYYTRKENRRRRRRSAQAYIDVSSDNEATITDLKPGSEYEITVAVKNPKGVGPASDVLDVATKNGVPDTPSDVSLDTYADTVKLGWKPPKQPGIKNYTITYYPQDDPTNKKTKTIPADEREAYITDKDMDPQKYYTFEVQANNDDGKGKPWRMEGVVIGDPDAPGKPDPPIADAINDTKINVSFSLPDDYVGGVPKTFKICYEEENGKDKCFNSTFPDKPYIIIDDLDHTKNYKFWSVATNDKGEGERSEMSLPAKPLDPPTIPPPTTTTAEPTTTNMTLVIAERSYSDDKAFYEELWFIILLIILLILIIILIILCIICNRRGGKYPVGKKEKDYGGWDKDPLKDYSDNAMENGGADLPLISPARSPDQDSLKKQPFDDDEDEDSLADYGEGYGDMGQYGTDKKEKNGQTVC